MKTTLISVNTDAAIGPVKPMNAVNNGPSVQKPGGDQLRGNFEEYRDDRATAGGDPEGSWGWLADLGYDLVQTDWLLACSLFLERTGRRKA